MTEAGSNFNDVNTDINQFLRSKSQTANFQSTSLFIVTYLDVSKYNQNEKRYTFQAVIATNGSDVYVVLNYAKLDVNAEWVGFYTQRCGMKTWVTGDNTKKMVDTTNIGVTGRHIYRVAC